MYPQRRGLQRPNQVEPPPLIFCRNPHAHTNTNTHTCMHKDTCACPSNPTYQPAGHEPRPAGQVRRDRGGKRHRGRREADSSTRKGTTRPHTPHTANRAPCTVHHPPPCVDGAAVSCHLSQRCVRKRRCGSLTERKVELPDRGRNDSETPESCGANFGGGNDDRRVSCSAGPRSTNARKRFFGRDRRTRTFLEG